MRPITCLLVFVSATAVAGPKTVVPTGFTAKLEIKDVAKQHHALLVAKYTCAKTDKCADATLDLGTADGATLVGLADLAGDPHTVDSAELLPRLAGKRGAMPAAFVRVTLDDHKTRKESLVVVGLQLGDVHQMFADYIELQRSDGGGLSTRAIELVDDGKAKPLALEYVQETLPGQTSEPYRPGPPMHRRFIVKAGKYAPQEK